MSTQSSLQEQLQVELCPPLDTSLIAAFVGELSSSSSPEDIEELRAILCALAAQAEHQGFADALTASEPNGEDDEHHRAPVNANGHPQIDPTSLSDDASSVSTAPHELSLSGTNATSITSSTGDARWPAALRFLQAAFPGVDPRVLRSALLREGGSDDDTIDMEDVVGDLMSREFARELEERGKEAGTLSSPELWTTVNAPRKKPAPGKAPKKKAKGRTVTLVDVRQTQHAPPRIAPGSPRPTPAPDPWIATASLSSRLADLLPLKPDTFFASFLHSDKHATPAAAVRAALLALIGGPTAAMQPASPQEAEALVALFEILGAQTGCDGLDSEQRDTLMDDVQLALRASPESPEDALEVVTLLSELDADRALTMGVYHSRAPSAATTAPASPRPSAAIALRDTISVPSSPILGHAHAYHETLPLAPSNDWTQIPHKRAPRALPTHAAFIPALDPVATGSRRLRGMGNGLGKGGKGDVGELGSARGVKEAEKSRRRITELREQRERALRDATSAWRRGTAKNHGGEVAMVFAERARALQDQAKMVSLQATREIVEERRTPEKPDIDLHGATIFEAVEIVKQILSEELCTPTHPLRIITGKGKHSAGGVGVLGPSVRSALVQDGWNVQQQDGGLLVCGRR